jgi:putative folate metabolism gamma-glutamate ligase
MNITVIKTPKITAGSARLLDLLDRHVAEFHERNILAVTSKIVSLCEGAALHIGSIEKEALIARESDKYLPATLSKYGHHFTIKNDTLIPMAGIDESNTDGYYVLWPSDAQRTCNEVREYLLKRFSVSEAGVIITDSTCQPLRRGTTGICLAHSGFVALNSYIGQADLFERPMQVTQASISGGLAAAAVVCMGEGAEQTPLAIISGADFVKFQPRNPNGEELEQLHISLEDDLFAPFLEAVTWHNGARRQ